MVKKFNVLTLIALLITLAACVPAKELENLGVINSRGIDISEDDSSQIETTLIIFQFDSQSDTITKTISGVGDTIKGAQENADTKATFKLSANQIRFELYGKETAKKGLLRYISTSIRDARASGVMLMAISDTTAKDILTSEQAEPTMNIGQYLHGLIEQEHDKDNIPGVEIYEFAHKYSDVGQDPILPVISLINNTPTLTGMAVFQGDKYVDEISVKDAFFVNLFLKKIKSKTLELTIPRKPFEKYIETDGVHEINKVAEANSDTNQDFHITIDVDGKGKTKLLNIDELHFQTDFDLEVNLNETSELMSVKNEEAANLLELEIEKEIKTKYEALLKRLQEINSDPFGYGNIYRASKKDGKLTKKEWIEKFPNVRVDFNVNVKLIQYGTLK